MSDIPVAVLIIHGVGAQTAAIADGMIAELTRRFTTKLKQLLNTTRSPKAQIICRAVHWAPILQQTQKNLWSRLTADHDLDYVRLRQYLIEFAGDAIAYQITPHDRLVYESIHQRVTDTLVELAAHPQICPASPLAIIGHSLGSVIASNWIWDQQHNADGYVAESTPLTRGETLARLFTLGSPLALWSLRYTRPPFGLPVTIPAPQLRTHFPTQRFPTLAGEWLNVYDEDDVIASPLKPLNAAYDHMVTRDLATNVGSLFTAWNPLSHNGYWTDDDVTVPIAGSLARLWADVNRPAAAAEQSSESHSHVHRRRGYEK